MTKREAIQLFRKELNQVNADSTYTNQFLYNSLLKHAKWLIKREVSAGRIYKNNSVFQTLRRRSVIEVPVIESCLDIKTKCRIYRTREKVPEIWTDNDGHIVRFVRSIDNSTKFDVTTITTWYQKEQDPYQQMSKTKYCFYADGYLWFPKENPHLININAMFIDDVDTIEEDHCSDCEDKDKECVRFLDTKFVVPDWVEGEMYSRALQSVAGITMKLQEDAQIDKNPNRKN